MTRSAAQLADEYFRERPNLVHPTLHAGAPILPLSDEDDDDEADTVQAIPPYRQPRAVAPSSPRPASRPRAYKPGTRQLAAINASVDNGGSWWTKPDANFAQHAERMRLANGPRVPSANTVVGWGAVFAGRH